MRIVHLAAGAGGMYCGACARDISLAKGLIAQGDDVIILPLYTPLRVDYDLTQTVPQDKIFLGGINSWLQQNIPIFRKTPVWMDRLLDNPKLLLWASKFAVSVKAEELGPMTYSVLLGKNGYQRKEMDKLFAHMDTLQPFHLVSVTNTLLSAVAHEIRERYKIPVVCAFQGEDSFVEAFPEEWRSKVWRRMQENVRAVDCFISPSHDATERMSAYLQLRREKIHMIPTGIDLTRYESIVDGKREPFTVGYVSAIIYGKGLDILVEALRILTNRGTGRVRLLVAGKVMNPKYWMQVRTSISQCVNMEFKYLGEINFEEKTRLLRSCNAFSVPSRIPEVRSMAMMEAMACGTPVIAPNHGVFPELIGITSGGALFDKNKPEELANILQDWMNHPEKAEAYGKSAREGISKHYRLEDMIRQTRELYGEIAGQIGNPSREEP